MDLTRSLVHLRTSAIRTNTYLGGALTYLGKARPKLPCCASQILFTAPSILLLSETLNCDQLLFPFHSMASCILGLEDEVLRNRFLCCLAAVVTAQSTSATAL